MSERGSSSRGRGRPQLPKERIRQASISLRTSRQFHDQVARSAHDAGRSLSQEVEHRLFEAYAGEARYGGARWATVLQRLATAAATIEARYQTSPLDDQLAFKALRRSWLTVIDDEAPWKEPVLVGPRSPVLWREPGRPPRRAEVYVVITIADMPAAQADKVYEPLIEISPGNAASRIKLIIEEPLEARP